MTLQPASTRLWAAGVAALVESIAKVPPADRKPFMTLALKGNVGRSWLRLSLSPKRTRKLVFDLEILDSSTVFHPTGPVAWSVLASAADVLGLLTALDAVAERSAFDSTGQASESIAVYLPDQLDGAPEITGTFSLEYPEAALARGHEGRVWVEFIIDTAGTVQNETVRILMSDRDEFAQAVLDVLPKLRYAPGTRGGARVKALVRAQFTFKISRERLRVGLVKVPFGVRIP